MGKQARTGKAALDGRDRAGASTRRSQLVHVNFGRTWRMILKLSGTYSSVPRLVAEVP